MKWYGRVEVQLQSFLAALLGLSDHLHSSTSLPRRKAPLVAMNRKLDGPKSHHGRSGEKTNLLPLPGIELRFVGWPAINVGTIATALLQLPIVITALFHVFRAGGRSAHFCILLFLLASASKPRVYPSKHACFMAALHVSIISYHEHLRN